MDEPSRELLELVDVLAAGDGQQWPDFWENEHQRKIGMTMYGRQAAELLASSWLAERTASAVGCPTPCDTDCDAPCHELHAVGFKQHHAPNHHRDLARLASERDAALAALDVMHEARDDAKAEAAALRQVVETVRCYVDDPGNWSAADGRRGLLHHLLAAAIPSVSTSPAPTVTHVVRRGTAEVGVESEALCGHRWEPVTLDNDLPVCNRCHRNVVAELESQLDVLASLLPSVAPPGRCTEEHERYGRCEHFSGHAGPHEVDVNDPPPYQWTSTATPPAEPVFD